MITLSSIGKDVSLNGATRKIQRAINEELLKDVDIGTDGNGSIPAINMERANEKAIMLLAGLTQDEVDNLSIDDYQTLLEAVNDITKEMQKKTKN